MLAGLIWYSIFFALLGACATSSPPPIEAANPNGSEMVAPSIQAPQHYRFYPGDELSVTAVNRPELTVSARLDPYGYIAYPYLGQVYVKDLTSEQVAERLAQGLRDGDFYRRVALQVSFVGSKEQYVYVLGEVKKPGPVQLIGSSISLLDALGRAEGKTHDAEMSTVIWMRPRQSPPGVARLNLAAFGDPAVRDPKIPNVQLMAGDVIYVPDSTIVSVQRFANRMFDIIRPVLALETSIILLDGVTRVLNGTFNRGNTSNQTIILVPSGR